MDGRSRERLRVARLPATSDHNPYQRLLYGHLAAEGIDLVGDGRLGTDWLLAHRDDVDLLHIHWRLDRLVDDGELGPPRPRTADEVEEAAAWLEGQLREAGELGYRIAWTVHEIGRLGGAEPSLGHLAAVVLGRRADLVLTHDQVATARVLELGLCPPERIRTTPLGHYGDAHGPGAPLARADLGLAEDATVLLAFGHRRADKAMGLLLDAFALLDRPDVRLVLAGRVEPGEEMAIADDRVLDLGHLPDEQVAPLHRLCDAAVVARGYEWTPSSLVLGLSHGLPVVAADLASVAEHGGPGVFPFHPDDAADLATTLARVVDDPVERRVRGAAGRAFVRRATWDDTARATAEALRTIVAT